jgi:RNase H-like domain found in reverse transcriptase
VDAILKLLPPRTKNHVRSFLGMINYYRDMWRKRSHLISPLVALSSKSVPFTWTEQCQKSFEDITKIVAQEVLLNYPNFNVPFDIFTDASEKQLGVVIMQNNRPIAFYSRKLNPAQCKYTTGEQELLAFVKTVKQYRNILLGYDIKVFTDHKNLLYSIKAIIR